MTILFTDRRTHCSRTLKFSLPPNSWINPIFLKLPFLTWKIIFSSCRCGAIHSITPSLPVRRLETRGSLHMKKPQGILFGKFESNSYGRLMWTLPELYYTPKRYELKRNGFDYQLFVQERIPWALVDPTRVIERSAEIKRENKLNKSVSFNYYFF